MCVLTVLSSIVVLLSFSTLELSSPRLLESVCCRALVLGGWETAEGESVSDMSVDWETAVESARGGVGHSETGVREMSVDWETTVELARGGVGHSETGVREMSVDWETAVELARGGVGHSETGVREMSVDWETAVESARGGVGHSETGVREMSVDWETAVESARGGVGHSETGVREMSVDWETAVELARGGVGHSETGVREMRTFFKLGLIPGMLDSSPNTCTDKKCTSHTATRHIPACILYREVVNAPTPDGLRRTGAMNQQTSSAKH